MAAPSANATAEASAAIASAQPASPALGRFHVERPRLTVLLSAVLDGSRRMIWVWSAAGSGKTTLLGEWAESLRAGGRELVRYSGEEFLEAAGPVAREAREPASSALVVMVDDAHRLSDAAAGRVAALAQSLPPGSSLVLAGRYQPFRSRALVEAMGEPIELRMDDLAFTAPETTALAAMHSVTLDEDMAQTLVRRTGGWATALTLAMTWLGSSKDPESAVARFDGDNHAVADYLTAEMLRSLSDDERTVLSAVAIRPRVPFELAIALSGRPDAGRVLDAIARRNGLIVESPDYFDFHPVLLSFLQADARRRDAGAWAEGHRRASLWFSAEDKGVDALEEAMLAGDETLIGRTVDRFGLDLALSGDTDLVFRAATHMSAERAPLSVLAIRLLQEAPDFADAHRVDHLFGRALVPATRTDSPADGRWLAVVLALRCLDQGSLVPMATRLERLTRADVAAARSSSLAVDLVVSTAEAWGRAQLGESDAAARLLERVVAASYRAGLTWLCMFANELGATVATMAGSWDQAVAFEERISTEMLSRGRPVRDRVRAAATIIAAGRAYRRGEELPYEELDRIIKSDPLGSEFGLLVPAQMLRALPGLDSDPNPRASLEAVEAIATRAGPQLSRLVAPAALRLVSLRLSLDGRAQAKETAAHLVASLGESSMEGELIAFALAFPSRIADPAEERLALAARRGTKSWHAGAMVSAWLLLAEAAESMGRHAEADVRIGQALRAAKRVGTIQPFLARSGSGARLVEQRTGRLGHLEEFGRRVVAVAGERLPVRLASARSIPPLTAREHEVLAELPAYQSVAEIAAGLRLSVNTVKTHLRSIYQKLGVSERSEAVAVAQLHGLL